MSALEVDAVLRRMPALDLYRANVFRVTGVAPGASDAQIRRRREEAELAARLGADPGGDPQALKAAFEALRNPVLRLVHELFWLWDSDGPHDDAVRAHVEALESGAGDGAWRQALLAWAKALDDEDVWRRMHDRAAELDDPRVGEEAVQRLREVAPLRILAVGAHAAAAAAAAGDEATAARHVALLESSPCGAALAARAVRDAVRTTETDVRDDVEEAERVSATEPEEAVAAAHRLLDRVGPGLQVLGRLLPRDPLTAALHDEVAHAVAVCAVTAFDATGVYDEALDLLGTARGLARERTTVEYVERNRRIIADAQVLDVVAPLLEGGRVDAAAAVLRLWRRQCTDPGLRERLDRIVEDPRAVRAPVEEEHARAGYLGCGVRPFGRRAEGDDETWVETRCVTVVGVPVYPLGAYLSDKQFVYAKVPLSPATRWAQLLVLWVLAVVVAGLVFGVPGAGLTAAALAALVAADALRQRQQTRSWLAERLAA